MSWQSGGTNPTQPLSRYPLSVQPAECAVDMSRSISYNDYASSPVHRFFQMWQQLDCSAKTATRAKPERPGLNDLFPWVETTVEPEPTALHKPANFTDQTTGEGSTAMQFLNVAKGDAPYFTTAGTQYPQRQLPPSDPGWHGRESHHVGLRQPPSTTPIRSPANRKRARSPDREFQSGSGTNNWYTQDGYGDGRTGNGGSYVNCADDSQPGL